MSNDPWHQDEQAAHLRESFLRLFLRHETQLEAFLRMMLPPWADVDDVLQESSVAMWRKMDQLRNEDEFLPWAKAFLRFEALKHIRQRARDRHVFSDTLVDLLASESDGDDVALFDRERKALQLCLSALSQEHRELVFAPYQGDKAIKELADQTKRTPNALYKMIAKLKVRIQDCVKMRMVSEGIA